MKPRPFDYRLADDVESALEILAERGDDAKLLAGGQSLGPLLNLRFVSPAMLVDLNAVRGLDSVELTNGVLRLGALVRHRALERSDVVRTACPLLAEAIPHVGHVAVRNRGTVGGSLAHADPAAELGVVAAALGGEVEVRGRGEMRLVPAECFFLGPFMPNLRADELVAALRLPACSPRSGHAWVEVSRRHGDFAIVGVGAALTFDDLGRCTDVRLGYAGVNGAPFLAHEACALLKGSEPQADLLAAVADRAVRECNPGSDPHAPAEFRQRLVRTLTERALRIAADRAAGPS